jgi:O-antigen/teichoic acid export membrane protein/O-antigen ligase
MWRFVQRNWMSVTGYQRQAILGMSGLIGGSLLLGGLLGWAGFYACIMIMMGCVLGIAVVLRIDAFSVTLLAAIHLYVDWYLGLHLIAPGLAMILLLLYYLMRSPTHPWNFPRFPLLWIIFLVVTIYPSIRGGVLMTYDAASFYPSDILGAFLMYWLGIVVVSNQVRLQTFFVIFTCFAVLLALHTLYQSVTGTVLFASSRVNDFLSSADVAYYQFTGSTTQRTGSFFIDPNWNGAFFALVFFLPLGLFVCNTAIWQKLCALFAMMIILLALMCTYSTGAWIAFLVGGVIFLIFMSNTYYRILLPAIALCITALMIMIFPAQIALQLQHIAANNELSLRIAAWRTALRIIQAYPLTGVGLGHQAYLIRSDPYRVPEQFIPLSHPHDSYLEWAAMAGIPVLGIFVLLILSALWLAWRNWQSANMSSRSLIGAGIASTITLSINSISINGWTHFALAMIGWLILGAIASPSLYVKRDHYMLQKRQVSMATVPPMSQNDENKKNDVSVRYTKRLYKPSLLKDPKTLFDAYGANTIPSFSVIPSDDNENTQNLSRQSPGVPFFEARLESNFSSKEHISTDQQLTWLIPALGNLERIKKMSPSIMQNDGYALLIRQLMKDSGIYAIVSCLSPLISLLLAPFLTHQLSRGDYGVLVMLNTTIVLLTGLTQCGQGNAFFWAYHNEASSVQGRRLVLSTMVVLLLSISLGVTVLIEGASSWLSHWLLHSSTYVSLIRIAALVMFMQNMTVPILSWLRLEGRVGLFFALSLCNLCINLGLTVFLVGMLQWGISGALLAVGAGYAGMIVCTLPLIDYHIQWHFQWTMARRLLTFGLSTVPGLLSIWILQLSDRYFLIYFGSLSQAANYAVAYTLGNVMGPLIITPFSLAWYASIYNIARKKNAKDIFRLIFRWYGFLVLLIAMCISLFAKDMLEWFFPRAYDTVASIIPFIALSNTFYGIFEIFTVGVSLQGKQRLNLLFLPLAAVINIGCNVVCIPLYGVSGAAVSTLIAYIVLALIAYCVNQQIYPVPFEIGLFGLALCLGCSEYLGVVLWMHYQSSSMSWISSGAVVCLYAGTLIVLGRIPARNRSKK